MSDWTDEERAHVASCRFRCGHWLPRLLRVEALTLGRTVYACGPVAEGSRLHRHEAAHLLQFRRHGVARFIVRYLREYLRGRLAGLGHAGAYRAISFEREARERE